MQEIPQTVEHLKKRSDWNHWKDVIIQEMNSLDDNQIGSWGTVNQLNQNGCLPLKMMIGTRLDWLRKVVHRNQVLTIMIVLHQWPI